MSAELPELLARARAAQRIADGWDQARVNDVVAAVAWHLYEPTAARQLTDLAFAETGLGNREHLFELHRRRVIGALADMHEVVTVGLIESDDQRGIDSYARPIGVLGMLTPATAPSSGIATNVLQCLKTRNAALISPNPRARESGAATVAVVRLALASVGAPVDLIQCVDATDRAASERLMSTVDLVIAAGGQGTLRRSYRSGTPALSAGAGNPTAIVDETADLETAAERIIFGVGFNHGTSCSSESNVLVHESAYQQFRPLLERSGAYLCNPAEAAALIDVCWQPDGSLNRKLIGRSPAELAEAAGITLTDPDRVSALGIECGPGADPSDTVFGEKLSPVFTVSSFGDFDTALDLAAAQIANGGPGHSCGLHTTVAERVDRAAQRLQVCRVLVNQSTAVGNSGSFENGMPFTAVISTGSWGGCSQSQNITWRHLVNVVSVSRTTTPRIPDEFALFGRHLVSREPVGSAAGIGDPS
jgi:sulfoacetaldehyde dehydrogenase